MAEFFNEDILAYCLAKPGAWQDEPWEGDVVAKVGDKVFAFLGNGESIGLKLGRTREEADELVAVYPEDVTPSSHIGRFGWNRVNIGGKVPVDELHELIDASYEAFRNKLPKSKRPPV
ncbi:MmcQ/YjbR family DNA-binding protein [Nocardia sp. NBC_01388]|uniref:MmcQ/YjbR family DNA-binding protein n=1 Tax=Nocardia sp. NBC_01388 TaxID=2903596 RepID=UPI0032463A2B